MMNKALTIKNGRQHGQRYVQRLFDLIEKGQIDPSYLLTHSMTLDQGHQGYKLLKYGQDRCLRVVFRPN